MAASAFFALLFSHAAAFSDYNSRRLSFNRIGGYEPGSNVVQHNQIDLDQAEMETHLSATARNYTAAKAVYTRGGNSGAYAEISVSALANVAQKHAVVTQAGNAAVTGYMKSEGNVGALIIKVSYTSKCKEGGTSNPDKSGCFVLSGGNIYVAGVDVGAPSSILNKYRTLAGFSTAAQVKMAGQEYYAVYRAYFSYGEYSYRMVMDALAGTGTCSTCDDIARVEIAKKSSAYMGVWMYVIREMEDAIMDCQNGCINCNDDPVHAWDEAVAFYTGSLEGITAADAGTKLGVLLHQLADKRCANFGTCASANTNVNTRIFAEFDRGRAALESGRCVAAVPIKRRIVNLMSVPLVQGSLRYAYKVGVLSGGSKERAEGAVFSAAILPRIAACNANAADLISTNMAYTAASPMSAGYIAVKEALESTYTCMGITCEEVGGLIVTGSEYYEHAGPCVQSTLVQSTRLVRMSEQEDDKAVPIGVVVGVIVCAVVAGAFCVVAAYCFIARNKAVEELRRLKAGDKHENGANVLGHTSC